MERPDWRQALQVLAAFGLGACHTRPAELPSVPMSELEDRGRVVVLVRSDPVEVLQTADGIRARSLLCTHMGCQVKWHPEYDEYRCPCHEGRYDRNGRVIEGMPSGPLREVAFNVVENAIVFPDAGAD